MKRISRKESIQSGMVYKGPCPEGWVLAHNHFRHTENSHHGEKGFRRFWLAYPVRFGFSVCRCGWRPDLGEHYSRPEP
jgi:hypothetical protein